MSDLELTELSAHSIFSVLAEVCERLSGANYAVEVSILRAINPQATRLSKPAPYTASLDAAMTLVPKGWCKTVADYWCEGDDKPPFFADCGDLSALKSGDENAIVVEAYAATPALALCTAALRAHAALAQQQAA